MDELRIAFLGNQYPRSGTSARYRRPCLQLIILDADEFDTISETYDTEWCGRAMAAECKVKVDEKRLLAKYSDDEKVKKETSLKKAYMWFVDAFDSFYD